MQGSASVSAAGLRGETEALKGRSQSRAGQQQGAVTTQALCLQAQSCFSQGTRQLPFLKVAEGRTPFLKPTQKPPQSGSAEGRTDDDVPSVCLRGRRGFIVNDTLSPG